MQNSQYTHADEIVLKIRRILGNYPSFRALHADGRIYQGSFRANEAAKQYTRAVHLQGQEVPATVGFSKGGGDPFAHFGATVGMAIRFYLPNGRITNLVMLSQKLFIARSVGQFLGLLEAGMPTEPGGKPNLTGLHAFLADNPNSRAVFEMRAASLAPVSFAHTEFNSVHAFRYINVDDHETPARCHWVPTAGVRGQPVANLAADDIEALYLEIEERLRQSPVSFDLVLELAEPGDELNDATALWPEDRHRVVIGRLSLTGPTTEERIGDKVMNHDPTVLSDGIEPTDDPILQIRRGVYEASAAGRTGGWHADAFGKSHKAQ